MTELSSRAAALVRAGRTASRPSLEDRERITSALRARLGDAVLPFDPTSATSLAKAGWLKVSALGAAVGVASLATYLALRPPEGEQMPGPVREAAAVRVEAAAPQRAVPAPALTLGSAAPPAAASAASSEPSVTSARRADSLAQEVAILSRATSELRAGRAANALKWVEEHRRKFPNGVLAEERRAARVQALCALGRQREAEPELARLARIAPQSPNTLRAKQLCGKNGSAP